MEPRDRPDVRPASGPDRSDDDRAAELPPFAAAKPDLGGGTGDEDRRQPYAESAGALRFDDVEPPPPDTLAGESG